MCYSSDTRPTPTTSIEASSKLETTSTINTGKLTCTYKYHPLIFNEIYACFFNLGTSSAIPTQSFQSAIDLSIVVPLVVLCGIIVAVAVIIVMIAAILICRKRSKKNYYLNDTVVYSRCDYTCLVFFQNKKKNVWSFTYAISHKNHCHVRNTKYY